MKAIITVGVSGSGKSTYALTTKAFDAPRLSGPGWEIIERDQFREQVCKSKVPGYNAQSDNLWHSWSFKWEKEANLLREEAITKAVEAKQNIILSDTNLNPAVRADLKSWLESKGYEVEVFVVGKELTLDQLWANNTKRKNVLSHSVVAEQYTRFRQEFPMFELKDVTGKPAAYIFDVDGTLAHMNGKRKPYEWDKVGSDDPNPAIFGTLQAAFLGGHEIIVMSGRSEVCREATKNWIDSWYAFYAGRLGIDPIAHYKLYMRPQGDNRSDVIVKRELFFNHVDGNYKVECVFDDRPVVVRQWRDMGLKVVQCGDPYVEF